MALSRVADAFADLTEKIVVNVNQGGTRDHGLWVDGADTPNDCEAVVQPMGDNEVNTMNPDGDSDMTHLKFYIDAEKYTFDMQTADDSKKAVTVDYDGTRYKALKITNYAKLGGFRVIYAVQERG